MPPKKTQPKGSKAAATPKSATKKRAEAAKKETRKETDNVKADAPEDKTDAKSSASASKKRKQPTNSQNDAASKARRKSSRGAAKPEPALLLQLLLSDLCIDLCRPADEVRDLKNKESHNVPLRTYSTSELSPFEELISAIILSRPISHALGVRSIRTILNEPYNFTTPKAIQDAGPERRLQALWDARTQHKDKTAAQLGQVAGLVAERYSKFEGDTSLDAVREAAGRDMDEESDLLIKSIKGIGKTGMSIFFRRVQWLWEECYPYVDERTERALVELGLPPEPDELRKLIEESWGSIGKGIKEGKDEEARKRRAFVIVLEHATGAQLEGNTSQLLEEASSTQNA